jgi:hypothetical protein
VTDRQMDRRADGQTQSTLFVTLVKSSGNYIYHLLEEQSVTLQFVFLGFVCVSINGLFP